jgi:hypothetical protein
MISTDHVIQLNEGTVNENQMSVWKIGVEPTR